MFDETGIAEAFRTEWTRVVATLVRDLGDLGLAEEVAQDAFYAAAERWRETGTPERPGAWLTTTARRKAIDVIRRRQRFEDRLPELARRLDQDVDADPTGLVDEQLALLLGCCHPALPPEGQVALTLRAVAGLSTAQIARAFLVSEPTMTRRLTRAKDKIRATNIPFRVADREVLVERLGAVCAVVHSIFTEGHTAATSTTLIRGDLCDEAIWLAELLATLVPDAPEVLGLHALLLLTDARRDARTGTDGLPVLLADQDRSRWDQASVSRGLATLARAHSHRQVGQYQLQAAIAALHSTAATFDDTDWARIVSLYDVLLVHHPSAITGLNRAAAIGHRDGPAAGLAEIDALSDADRTELATYPYLHAARAEFLRRLGSDRDADAAFDAAIAASQNDAERRHLERRRRA